LERALLGNNIITYTGLVNLELIPKVRTFIFYGLPLKIKGGDGSPVRAIAIIENGDTIDTIYVSKENLIYHHWLVKIIDGINPYEELILKF